MDASGLKALLEETYAAGSFPGAVLAAAGDAGVVAAAVGHAELERAAPMEPGARFLAGSVGKTFFAALALSLVEEGRLELDVPARRWLGRALWLEGLPAGEAFTVRDLLRHSTGLPRWEFHEEVARRLLDDPDHTWTPEERMAYVPRGTPPFAPGQGWVYSDTNYIVLAVVLERVLGRDAYGEIRRRFLVPLRLQGVTPSDRRRLPGLVQGYADPADPFGGGGRMVGTDGRLTVNPQMEWAGGGFATTALDLARWGRALWGGAVLAPATLSEMGQGVAAPFLGEGVRYGLGVMLRPTEAGLAWGHSGFFPGYLSEVRHYPALGVAVALHVNTSEARRLPGGTGRVLDRAAALLGQAAAAPRPQSSSGKSFPVSMSTPSKTTSTGSV